MASLLAHELIHGAEYGAASNCIIPTGFLSFLYYNFYQHIVPNGTYTIPVNHVEYHVSKSGTSNDNNAPPSYILLRVFVPLWLLYFVLFGKNKKATAITQWLLLTIFYGTIY